MSYYQLIEGRTYDRQLLELADQLVSSKGDGRISEKDATQIAEAMSDRTTVTAIENDTFQYILNRYKFTDKAILWLKDQYWFINDADHMRQLNRIKRKFDLRSMKIKADLATIMMMHRRFKSKVNFYESLEKALEQLLVVDTPNTPKYEVGILINNLYQIHQEDFKDPSKWNQFVTALLKERINEGHLELIPIWEEIPQAEHFFAVPDNQESSSKHWIFFLDIQTDDHQFWVTVDRNDVNAHTVYGIN